MYNRSRLIKSKNAKGVTARVIPGHFATNHSHINFYVDLTDVKVRRRMAKQAAEKLALMYGFVSIDTIVCQEGTEMIGAFMADTLSRSDLMKMNVGADISVLTPELNTSGQLIFRENTLKEVRHKAILLLISSISAGHTAKRAIECIQYYNGNLVGVSALFSNVPEIQGYAVHSIFTGDDIPHYRVYSPESCELCTGKLPLDAIVNGTGFSKL